MNSCNPLFASSRPSSLTGGCAAALLLVLGTALSPLYAALPTIEILAEIPGDGRGGIQGTGRQSWFPLHEMNDGYLHSRGGAGSDAYLERVGLIDGSYAQIAPPVTAAMGIPRGGLWLSASDGQLYALHAEHHDSENAGYTLKRFTAGNTEWVTVAALGTVRNNAHFRAIPTGTLAEGSDGRLYGVTPQHADLGEDIRNRIWSVGKDGSGYLEHHAGSDTEGNDPVFILRASDSRFYGLTSRGGAHDNGVIFRLEADGSAYTRLHDFDAADGVLATGEFLGLVSHQLVEHDGRLHGIRHGGGAGDGGLLYRIALDGSGYEVLREFGPTETGTDGANIDGRNPRTLLSAADGHLYGVAIRGGVRGGGTVFRHHRTLGFQVLYAFDGRRVGDRNPTVNATGIWPTELMQASNGSFYGRTNRGGYGGSAESALCRQANAPLAQGCDGGVIFRFVPGDELPDYVIEPALNFDITARWADGAFIHVVPVAQAGDLVEDHYPMTVMWSGQKVRDCTAESTQPGSTWTGPRDIAFGVQTENHAPIDAPGIFSYRLRCISDDDEAREISRSIDIVVQPKDLAEQHISGGGAIGWSGLLSLILFCLYRLNPRMNQPMTPSRSTR